MLSVGVVVHQHLAHVAVGLRERNPLEQDVERCPLRDLLNPASDIVGPAVVGGDRQWKSPSEPMDQGAQIPSRELEIEPRVEQVSRGEVVVA